MNINDIVTYKDTNLKYGLNGERKGKIVATKTDNPINHDFRFYGDCIVHWESGAKTEEWFGNLELAKSQYFYPKQ